VKAGVPGFDCTGVATDTPSLVTDTPAAVSVVSSPAARSAPNPAVGTVLLAKTSCPAGRILVNGGARAAHRVFRPTERSSRCAHRFASIRRRGRGGHRHGAARGGGGDDHDALRGVRTTDPNEPHAHDVRPAHDVGVDTAARTEHRALVGVISSTVRPTTRRTRHRGSWRWHASRCRRGAI
jgi:hypothetical protein